MSRIFDALRRAGAEQSGIEYPDVVTVATKVFESSQPDGSNGDGGAERISTVEMPSLTMAPSVVPQNNRAESTEEFPTIQIAVRESSRLVFLNAAESLAAEKFRFLGVRLREMRQSRPLKRVLVTSSIPEEGKSTVSSNLAGVLARKKEKVLLIDGDLRRPVLSEEFGVGKPAGLAEWLQSGAKTFNIYRLPTANLWFMPAGSPPERPLELMQSGKLAQLMQQLSEMFDWIVVDSPPLLPLADTTVWARLMDGVLLVAREGKTEKAQLKRGLDTLKQIDVLGLVLNSCSDTNEKSYYHRYLQKK